MNRNETADIPIQTDEPALSPGTRWPLPDSRKIVSLTAKQQENLIQLLSAAIRVLRDDEPFAENLRPLLGKQVSVRAREITYSFERDDLPFADIEVHFRRSQFDTELVPALISIRAYDKIFENVHKDQLEAQLQLIRSWNYLPDIPPWDWSENFFSYHVEATQKQGVYPLYVDISFSRAGAYPLSSHDVETSEYTRFFKGIVLRRNWKPTSDLKANGLRIGEPCPRSGVWRAADLSSLQPIDLPGTQYIRRGTQMPFYRSGRGGSEHNQEIRWYWVDDGLE